MAHTFSDAPGQPDGLVLGRLNRRGDAPFGKPFKYTDPFDLTGEFSHPEKDKGDGRYPGVRTRLPWYKRLFRRKPPVAWAVVEPSEVPTAYVMTNQDGEVRVSAIAPRGAFVQVHDDTVIIGAKEYEQAHPEEEGVD